MQYHGKSPANYHEEQDIDNTLKMREILGELPRFCRQYFRAIEQTASSRTCLGYAYDLRTFFEFLRDYNPALSNKEMRSFPVSILEQIGREDIEEYLDYLSYYEKDGRVYTNSDQAKARKLSALRSLFQYYYKSEIISRDVTALVQMPKRRERPIIRLDGEEMARLLKMAEEGTGLTGKELAFHKKTKVRDVAILTLLLGTGIRVSECVGLDLTDINFREGAVRVHRKGGYDAIVYFGEEVAGALADYVNERRNTMAAAGHEKALFLSIQHRRITVRAVEKLVKKYASRVTSLKKITPHKLRSSYGTALYRATGDIYLVADVLGHRDVNTTRRHYAAIDEDRRRSAADAVRLREDEDTSADENIE